MERLWSQAGAPVATHGNGLGAHSKEGVDGSSPSEGFTEIPAEARSWIKHLSSRRATDKLLGIDFWTGRDTCTRSRNVVSIDLATADDRFDYQPSLSGRLLQLRPLRRDDFAALHAAASDPGIWEQHPVKNRHREDVFQPYFEALLDSREALVALDRATGAIVGMSRFHGYDPRRSEVEIGWTFLARSHWGGTYNRELKDLMLRHAFRFVRTVVFLISPDNARSRRAVEKIGGVRFGSRPDADGRESIAYRIESSEFGVQRLPTRARRPDGEGGFSPQQGKER